MSGSLYSWVLVVCPYNRMLGPILQNSNKINSNKCNWTQHGISRIGLSDQIVFCDNNNIL